MMKRVTMRGILMFSLLSAATGHAFAPANFGNSYGYGGRLPALHDVNFKVGAKVEYGDSKTGLNSLHKRRNVLALQDDTQSALPMLRNRVGSVLANDELTTIIQQLRLPLFDIVENGDNGVRGHQQLSGRFSELDATFYGSYSFACCEWGGLSLGLYIPVVWKKVDHVKLEDLTAVAADPNPLSRTADRRVRQILTPTLADIVKKTANLDLSAWDDSGLGDISALLEWKKKFSFNNDVLKRLIVMAKAGVVFPSSKQKDEDRAFSMPLGADGAWGMPFGVALEMMFPYFFKVGVGGDVTVLFDKTRVRRLKTHVHQTEFLLLNKGSATKEYGLTWQLNAFVESLHFVDGLSAKLDYNYTVHEKDKLVSKDSNFDNATINVLNGLKQWDVHNLIVSLSYDFCAHKHYHCDHSSRSHKWEKKWHVVPQIQLFYKFAVDGKNMIDHDTFGGQLAISF